MPSESRGSLYNLGISLSLRSRGALAGPKSVDGYVIFRPDGGSDDKDVKGGDSNELKSCGPKE